MWPNRRGDHRRSRPQPFGVNCPGLGQDSASFSSFHPRGWWWVAVGLNAAGDDPRTWHFARQPLKRLRLRYERAAPAAGRLEHAARAAPQHLLAMRVCTLAG
ncbi:hypothetical protein [Candidatus Amarolinea aalborgensis]|uniref:hypothetical protein n=1 Tax=Candidatus Amarolinea aalborgensis TaxID=2249329 RepID=UPI003BFA263F